METMTKDAPKSKKEIVAIVILSFSLLLLVLGVSLAAFRYFGKGQSNNVLKTGSLTFSYSDAISGRNGILIENALPISDLEGKHLSGAGEYFDFNISATTSTSPLNYEITAQKSASSTLDEKYVKIYLTSVTGTVESETPLTTTSGIVTTFDSLRDTTSPSIEGKTIYLGTIEQGEVNLVRNYRLRMWVKEGVYSDTEIADKLFSVKVNVAALGTASS